MLALEKLNGGLLASGSADKCVKVWMPQTFDEVDVLRFVFDEACRCFCLRYLKIRRETYLSWTLAVTFVVDCLLKGF